MFQSRTPINHVFVALSLALGATALVVWWNLGAIGFIIGMSEHVEIGHIELFTFFGAVITFTAFHLTFWMIWREIPHVLATAIAAVVSSLLVIKMADVAAHSETLGAIPAMIISLLMIYCVTAAVFWFWPE